MTTYISAEAKEKLFQAACKAQSAAYLLPGNTYRVGAALLTRTGKIFVGCNIENAAHTPTVCAERVALFSAYAQQQRDIVAMVVVTDDGGACCGVCRQVIAELAPSMQIIITDVKKTNELITSLPELLPYSWSNPTLALK